MKKYKAGKGCDVDIKRDIRGRIFAIRGVQVLIDRDLAELYGVETKVLNQAVRRNANRFPIDFMFQLTKAEFSDWKSQFVTYDDISLRSQNVTLETRKVKHSKYCPYAFTEQGV
jgi:hypothetical protein